MSSGFLLRTRIRSAIEYLDQLYQYGEAAEVKTGRLVTESYDVPELDDEATDRKDTASSAAEPKDTVSPAADSKDTASFAEDLLSSEMLIPPPDALA